MLINHNPKLKAYSILEILITLAIFGVLSVVLMQSLLNNLLLSARINARSQIRSELDQTMSLMERDFRNADSINTGACTNDPPITINGITCASHCQISSGNKDIIWCFISTDPNEMPLKNGDITKYEYSAGVYTAIHKSSKIMNIDQFSFVVNVNNPEDASGYTPYANVLITLNASNNNLGITNQIRQLSVTTRNYQIK